ncbi:DUF6461 domain-containing protein [Streptomyces sp. NPDC096080]|uniref:DUF6461 domain-containing protein n=1 Tax=Streptomyces sp. NPDC096080 TaxID=3156693 RepID=UPI0033317C01
MQTSARDFLWFDDEFPDLARAHCLTFVRDVPPRELVRRLGGQVEPGVTGVHALVDAAYDRPSGAGRTVFGTTVLGEWTLLVEPNGWHGSDEALALPGSASTWWVSVYDNHDSNADGTFLWAEDTDVQLRFRFGDVSRCSGARADDLLGVVRDLGLDFAGAGDVPAGPAALALAAHLTGLRLTPAHLRDSVFVRGSAAGG